MIRFRVSSLLLFLGLFSLMGCVSLSHVDQKNKAIQVEVAPNTFVSLPTPAQLGKTLSLDQLISANWDGHAQVLPVHLEVLDREVLLIGFSSWGMRILTLSYTKDALTQDVLPGLGAVLPDGKEVLFNMMLALWPAKSWDAPLKAIGWKLIEGKSSRNLLDNKGTTVISIKYDAPLSDEKTPKTIVFDNLQKQYQITINTLS